MARQRANRKDDENDATGGEMAADSDHAEEPTPERRLEEQEELERLREQLRAEHH